MALAPPLLLMADAQILGFQHNEVFGLDSILVSDVVAANTPMHFAPRCVCTTVCLPSCPSPLSGHDTILWITPPCSTILLVLNLRNKQIYVKQEENSC